MRNHIGSKCLAVCLSMLMATSIVPGNVLASESEQTNQSVAASSEVTDQGEATEQGSEEDISKLDTYNMYQDGSGKNIESGEAIPKNWRDKLPSQGDSIQSIGGMKIGTAGLNMIKNFESCRLTAYKAVSTEKYWTIGWGHYGADVTQGMTITQERADQLLEQDVTSFENYVNAFSKKYNVDLNQNQFDALVSFTYNVGPKWTYGSTIATYLINGVKNYTEAQIRNAFGMWNKSGGKVLAGLTRRRNEEATLFLTEPVTSSWPTISSYTVPSDMNVGSSFTIRGTISSSTALKKVSVGVYDEDGSFMIGQTVTPNVKSYSLAAVDNAIKFGSLKAGTYHYIVSATNTKGTKELINQEFRVNCVHSYVSTTTKAKPNVNGKIVKKCSKCGTVASTTTIYAPTTVKLSSATHSYTGVVKKPSVTVIDSKGNAINSSNYSISYASGRVKVGTYKVTVTFQGSQYQGSMETSFVINPAKVSLRSVTSTSKGKLIVKWTRNTNATGYQIQYSKNADLTGGKTATVGNTLIYIVLPNLTLGKRYYARVRCYQIVNGVKYYSAYSDKGTVIIKK